MTSEGIVMLINDKEMKYIGFVVLNELADFFRVINGNFKFLLCNVWVSKFLEVNKFIPKIHVIHIGRAYVSWQNYAYLAHNIMTLAKR
jgi:hypothetical protein